MQLAVQAFYEVSWTTFCLFPLKQNLELVETENDTVQQQIVEQSDRIRNATFIIDRYPVRLISNTFAGSILMLDYLFC